MVETKKNSQARETLSTSHKKMFVGMPFAGCGGGGNEACEKKLMLFRSSKDFKECHLKFYNDINQTITEEEYQSACMHFNNRLQKKMVPIKQSLLNKFPELLEVAFFMKSQAQYAKDLRMLTLDKKYTADEFVKAAHTLKIYPYRWLFNLFYMEDKDSYEQGQELLELEFFDPDKIEDPERIFGLSYRAAKGAKADEDALIERMLGVPGGAVMLPKGYKPPFIAYLKE